VPAGQPLIAARATPRGITRNLLTCEEIALLGLLIAAGGTAIAPFIYTIF